MSDPQPSPPDWDSVFHRARRRILTRVLAIGSIAAVGALLLLGGGLSAQGTVTLPLLGNPSDAKSKPPKKKHHKPPKKHHKPPKKHHKSHHHSGKHHSGNHHHGKHHKQHPPPPPPPPCGKGSAAAQEYCDAPEEGPTPEPTRGVGGGAV